MYLNLLGGVFLGWSLGANDASNIFGTAVGSRMLRFRTAAGVAALTGRFGFAAVEGKSKVTCGTDVVTLGKTGIKTSVLGLGTGTRGGSEQRQQALRVCRRAGERQDGARIGMGSARRPVMRLPYASMWTMRSSSSGMSG